MDSPATPDSVEKGIVQSRRPHIARGWGLVALSFSSLGKRLSRFFHQYLISPVRRGLFEHRNLPSLRSK